MADSIYIGKKDNMESNWPQRALYFTICLLFVAEVVAASMSLGNVPALPSLIGNTFVYTFMGFIFGLVGAVWFALLLGTTFYRVGHRNTYLRKIVAPLAAAIVNFQFCIYGCILMAVYGSPLLTAAIYSSANEDAHWTAQVADYAGRMGSTEAQEVLVVLIVAGILGSASFDFFTAIVGITKINEFSPGTSMV
ncbi:hypothetical protein F5Y18DRAFT_122916 [Xylariaceae sp. FL1019]|nr:hypothetical protein F5Y18DRAFT_122916 [Xylariaceae sp. FL1019]